MSSTTPSTTQPHMSSNLQHIATTLPITSLSFLPSTHISESLLLSGEGPFCKIYSPSTANLLHSRRIFSREAVRGIAWKDFALHSGNRKYHGGTDEGRRGEEHEEDEAENGGNRRLVFWGGTRIVVTTVAELISDSPPGSPAGSLIDQLPSTPGNATISTASTAAAGEDEGEGGKQLQEISVKDWVHYAFFIPCGDSPLDTLVGVVTSHNELLLYDPIGKKWVGESDMGERCILYSATGTYIPDEGAQTRGGRVVVAAGTVFGEILVWSVPIDPPAPPLMGSSEGVGADRSSVASLGGESWTEFISDSETEPEDWEELTKSTVLRGSGTNTPQPSCRKRGVEVHYRLKGHEGSIFGVDISPQYTFPGQIGFTGPITKRRRYLASCSDDRTVRVWDISRVDVDHEGSEDEDDEDKETQRLTAAWDKVAEEESRGTTGFLQRGLAAPYPSDYDNLDSHPPKLQNKGERDKNECIAIGWGHAARIWNARFLRQISIPTNTAYFRIPVTNIVTTSEDLTSRLWNFYPTGSPTVSGKISGPVTLTSTSTTTHVHSGKNVFALAIDETHGLLATGGHDARVAVLAFPQDYNSYPLGMERKEWELGPEGGSGDTLEMELEALERGIGGLNIRPATPSTVEPNSPTNTPGLAITTASKRAAAVGDAFRAYAVVDAARVAIVTGRGWLAVYNFPHHPTSASTPRRKPSRGECERKGGWSTLGRWDNIAGGASLAAWEGAGLVAVQDRAGLVGLVDINNPCDVGNEGEGEETRDGSGQLRKKGRWWQAGDANPGPLFCGRHGDLFYLLTTSLKTPEVRLHLFPDPRVSEPHIRTSTSAPRRTKTVILCPPPHFQSVKSYYLDFSNGLLFLGSRTGVLSAFDVWSGAEADVMLNPLDSWRGWHDKDAITSIIAYPTNASGPAPHREHESPTNPFSQRLYNISNTSSPHPRTSRIITTGRNGVYAILEVSISPSTSRVTITKLHVQKLLNGGTIEGAYIRTGPENSIIPASPSGDLHMYGFRGQSFFVWNETRGYELFSEECGGPHRSWVFYHARGEERVTQAVIGWFAWTQAGKMCVLKVLRAPRKLLQQGLHGREIKALAISPPGVRGGSNSSSSLRIIATGAEDTLIRLSVLRPQRTEKDKLLQSLRPVAVFKKHTTGIQHLAWSECGDWLFSSGGVEEFYVWRVRRLEGGRIAVGVVCEATCPAQSVVPDLRIMGFDVSTVGVPWTEEGCGKAFLLSMVYSDSSIRIWLYDPSQKTFRNVISGRYKTSCLLHVHHYIHRKPLPAQYPALMQEGYPAFDRHSHLLENTFLLFIAGTDGHVTVYDITTQLRKAGISVTPAGLNASEPSIPEAAACNTEGNSIPNPLPPLIARPDLLTSSPPPTQLLPSPPRKGWSTQAHQSSIKSMSVLPLEAAPLSSTSSKRLTFGGAESSGGRLSLVVLTGGDDTAFAASVFTIARWWEEGGEQGGGIRPEASDGVQQTTASWVTRKVPEAHSSAITAVVLVRRGKMRWTGDVDSEPVKEFVVGVVSVGIDRALVAWEVSVLMGSGGAVKVSIKEGKAGGGGRGYSPVADIAGAAVLDPVVHVVGGEKLRGGRSEEHDNREVEGSRVIVVGVGVDVWDAFV